MSRVAIVDFGSQVTQLIARRIRELGVYSEVFSCTADISQIGSVDAFVLSGGPDSTGSLSDIPRVVVDIVNQNAQVGIPVLGVCYGAQVLAHYLGATVEPGFGMEFGRTQLDVVKDSVLTKGVWSVGEKVDVWMSHSDSIVGVPIGFRVVAYSVGGVVVAMMDHEARRIYGVQFHPEVTHTPGGKEILNNFLNIVGCDRDWNVQSFLCAQIDAIRDKVGSGRVIAAISGGVDSAVASVLIHRVVGDRLRCVFVDTGLLRKGEVEKARSLFSDELGLNVVFVDKANLFLERLRGVVDPEEKRKIVGSTFVEVFEQEALQWGGADFLAQGTIYPDVVESGEVARGSKIKSHHNVGGLPSIMDLSLVEPLRCLFKDEVRLLGAELGIPDAVLMQHPFPGPGLAVRIMGEVTEDAVTLLREVDNIYINLMREEGLYHSVWQAFAVLLPVRTVGVMGDARTYGYTCALRAVTSSDGMTAESFPFGGSDAEKLRFLNFLQKVSGRIVRELGVVNRVVYDITSKPPATIEWE